MIIQNKSEMLVHEYGRKIVSGELKPGDFLPKVQDISEMLGVSRTVVREALKGLSSRKLVKSNQKIGTVVLPSSEWQWWDIDVLTWAYESNKIDDINIKMAEVRLGLEPTAAALAAQRASDEDIDRIIQTYQVLEKSIDGQGEKTWAEADLDFHNSILLAADNPLIHPTLGGCGSDP